MKPAHLKSITEQIAQEILMMKDVMGVMLFSTKGEILFNGFTAPEEGSAHKDSWRSFILALSDTREVELVFDHLKLYVRKTEIGFIMVIMELSASISRVRLQCDVLMPSLTRSKPKMLARFFKKSE